MCWTHLSTCAFVKPVSLLFFIFKEIEEIRKRRIHAKLLSVRKFV